MRNTEGLLLISNDETMDLSCMAQIEFKDASANSTKKYYSRKY